MRFTHLRLSGALEHLASFDDPVKLVASSLRDGRYGEVNAITGRYRRSDCEVRPRRDIGNLSWSGGCCDIGHDDVGQMPA